MQKEKEQQDKLKAVKARLLYGDESGRNPRNHKESHYSESKTPTSRTEPRRRHGSPGRGRRVVYSIGWEEKNEAHLHILTVATKIPKQREPRKGGHLKSKQEAQVKTPTKFDLSRLRRVRKEPFTPQIWILITQDKDAWAMLRVEQKQRSGRRHLKLFQSTTKIERWAMPTWCHMFNSMITGNGRVWFDKLPKESIDSYEDLKTAFRENYLQQIKHIKDPMEIHHIKQRDGESTEDFMKRYKAELGRWMQLRNNREMVKSENCHHSSKNLKQNDKRNAPKKGGNNQKGKPSHQMVQFKETMERYDNDIEAENGIGHFRARYWSNIGRLGQISLLVKIGDDEHSSFCMDEFMGYKVTIYTNGIIGAGDGIEKITFVVCAGTDIQKEQQKTTKTRLGWNKNKGSYGYPHLSQVFSMAEIDSKEAQAKSKR
ncbi:reverse transcriptase domain-containing protein [Tanacetum coccineum]